MHLDGLYVLLGSLRTREDAISTVPVPGSADGCCIPSHSRNQAKFCFLLHKGKSRASPF